MFLTGSEMSDIALIKCSELYLLKKFQGYLVKFFHAMMSMKLNNSQKLLQEFASSLQNFHESQVAWQAEKNMKTRERALSYLWIVIYDIKVILQKLFSPWYEELSPRVSLSCLSTWKTSSFALRRQIKPQLRFKID